ncbi:MAG: AMP-binding protein [Tateyamaria sp.]|jgi:long-chain acyl-CoA synthetase/crotonobetaine/carnitine-CoA ligase|uniref:class I adenylate-forming enzyme family protein n=1 Tax=Tateyamaria sp. TaxID=1929288 RepID=UPI0032DC2BD3
MHKPINPLDLFLHDAAHRFGPRDVARWVLSGDRLTYDELAQKVRACATGLARLGVGTGTHVAVMLPSCPAGTITWFALARLGAVLTPLNPAYVSSELAFALSNADAEALIIDASLAHHLRSDDVRAANLPLIITYGEKTAPHTSWQDLLTHGEDAAPQPMQGSGLFSIQYTSGTTGRPKGCMLTQAYWDHFREGARDEFGAHEISSTLIWSPFFYMDAQWQLLLSMHAGATAHIVEKMSLSKLPEWLDQFQVNYFSFPEPFIQSLSDTQTYDWPLKFVNTFAWRPHNIEKLRRIFGPMGRDAFGMTEVGGVTASPTDLDVSKRAGSCGTPLSGCQIKIVDSDGNEVPAGQSGELLVMTPKMLLGYYNNPKVTKESYAGTWFRTGDLASMDQDGFLYIKGRLKEMIKRSGENIAAREVEAAILQHPAVQEVAVVGVADSLRKEEVKAFIILNAGSAGTEELAKSIATHCEEHLAAFKRPRYIEFTPDFPRTATRKVAKHQLAELAPVQGKAAWDQHAWTSKSTTTT